MAVYKVIQDIEAEDKLLGPLTLKGFVYAAIAAVLAYINIRLLAAGGPIYIRLIIIVVLLLPMLLFGILASPLGREQPTEVWLLSRIRYFLKPRQRIWDQEGQSDLVTVTVPKKQTANLTKDMTPNEVQSRLKSLALTLDTRGWAIKNADASLNEPSAEDTLATKPESDRLVGGGAPRQVPAVDIHPDDDILDEQNNPIARKFAGLINRADDERRQGVMAALKSFGGQQSKIIKPLKRKGRGASKSKASGKRPSDEEEALLEELNQRDNHDDLSQKLAAARMKFMKEHGDKKPASKHHKRAGSAPSAGQPNAPRSNPVTASRQAVNMELAQSGSAFSVATLSQLANRQPKVEQTGPDEVTISLH